MEANLNKIHDAALQILAEVGFRFMDEKATKILREHGIQVKDQVATFTRDQISHWVEQAPAAFDWHGANPQYNVAIGKDHSECVSGYGCASICEWDGSRRNATLEDYVTFAKLIHQSPNFKINGGILAQPEDIPADLSQLIMVYASALYTDKCLLGIPGSEGQMQDIMELMAIRLGGKDAFTANHHLLTMISTISPLQVDAMAIESMMTAGAYKQPVIISPAPAAGTTGPIELGTNLALATAEALACIAFCQMVCPGMPTVFGLQCYGSDLGSGNISIGSPAYALQAKYTAALARHYGLPSRCGGAVNDAKTVSCQSGYESMLSIFTAMQNRVNLIVHSAGILDSFAAISYEKFLIDMELMNMARYYLDDVAIPEESVNIELIKQVGHGGEFLTSMDTMKKCRTHSWNPEVSVRKIGAQVDAERRFEENILKQKNRMLEQYRLPEISEEVVRAMDAFMLDRGVDSSILVRIKEFGYI